MSHTATLRIIAVSLLALAALVTLSQTSVVNDGMTRACGSAFDVMADRTGWEDWWAADLDDPDAPTRTALLRTRDCPSAINTRVLLGAVLAGLAATSVLTGSVLAARADGKARPRSLAALGTATFVVGVVLTTLGMAAVVVLLADADSTLFLYVDRLVVAMIGLVVLVPTISLIVLGRALRLVAIATGVDQKEDVDA